MKPILFSAPMVQAILAGRKTQTRRVLRPRLQEAITFMDGDTEAGCVIGWSEDGYADDGWYVHSAEYPAEGAEYLGHCPYGLPGNHLWVREAIKQPGQMWSGDAPDQVTWSVQYLADGEQRSVVTPHDYDPRVFKEEACRKRRPPGPATYPPETEEDWAAADALNDWYRWYWSRTIPGIFMPRPFARLFLEVTEVRVERLQAISEEDAVAEGCQAGTEWGPIDGEAWRDEPKRDWDAVEDFSQLWNLINAKRALWESNPWVWVVTFEVVQ